MEEEDDFDEFFDCMDEDEFDGQIPEEDLMTLDNETDTPDNKTKNLTRSRISLSVGIEVKVIQLTLGKINTNNKIEGIQVYNRGTTLELESPTLSMAQRFKM